MMQTKLIILYHESPKFIFIHALNFLLFLTFGKGIIVPNNNIALEGLQSNLPSHKLLDEKARLSLLLDEQKGRPTYEELLMMQQNSEGVLRGQRMDLTDGNFPLFSSNGSNTLHDTSSGTFNQEPKLPLIPHSMASDGIPHLSNRLSNPFFEIELQQECRNIAALQEEVHRQIRQKQVVEELQIIDQLTTQQAMIIELENQKQQQQRITAEQLLSQFAGIDQLAARQEMINRVSNNLGQVPSNFADLSYALGIEDPRLLNLALVSGNQPSSALTQGVQVASLPGNDFSVLANNFGVQNALVNQASLIEKVGHAESHTLPSSNSNALPQMVPSVTIDKKDLPSIRYFNSGSEVQKNGEAIKVTEKTKKKKLVSSKVAKDPIRQKQKKISSKKAVVVKTGKTAMVKKGKKGINDKTAKWGAKPGPHHDLMIELFESKNNTAKNDEDKLDAATALLGFKTLS